MGMNDFMKFLQSIIDTVFGNSAIKKRTKAPKQARDDLNSRIRARGAYVKKDKTPTRSVAAPPAKKTAKATSILSLIGQAEAPRGYDQYWGGINLADAPPARLTQMTIGEVLAWQDSIDSKYNSEAAGRYQIMEDTLRGLYRRAGLSKDHLFNRANQDRLALALMGSGLKSYQSGRITADQFGDKLARIWAGLPVHKRQWGHKKRRMVNRGQSYYAGDGLNKSTVSPEAVVAAIRSI